MVRNVQIDDVDEATYAALRTQAAAHKLPLDQYLRSELQRLAGTRRPTMADLLAEADRWRAEHGGIPGDVLAAAHEAGRAERR